MPHLGSFRKGWENENLAKFILYKFCFVAHPSTVADDIGSDFFCTLFETRREDGHDYLLPRNSFAIQVKSNTDNIDITDKLQYLENLEIPFLVGVVNQERLKMTFYSGEYIPWFFALKGLPWRLAIHLCEQSTLHDKADFFVQNEDGSYIIFCPKLVEMDAAVQNLELQAKVAKIRETCSIIYENIARKKNGRFFFKQLRDNSFYVQPFAGSTSVTLFRNNLVEALAEAFVNLQWIYLALPNEFSEKEYKVYEDFLRNLESLESERGPLPEYVRIYYQELKRLIDRV